MEKISKITLRNFSYITGLGFPLFIGWFLPKLTGHEFRLWTIFIGLPILLIGFLAPNKLLYFYKIWMSLGHILGWFNSNTLTTPIPFGNHTYTLEDLIGLHPPFNIAGYQIPANLCVDCPYAPTLVGTYSSYTYTPTQNIFLDNEMIGDTINVFIESDFNLNGGIWYVGRPEPMPKETVADHLKVIIK